VLLLGQSEVVRSTGPSWATSPNVAGIDNWNSSSFHVRIKNFPKKSVQLSVAWKHNLLRLALGQGAANRQEKL